MVVSNPLVPLSLVRVMPRKKPFSNKQKKQQLQKKRMKKRKKGDDGSVSKDEEEILHLPDSPMATSPGEEEDKHVDPPDTETLHAPAQEVESLMGAGTKNDPKRFCMYFNKESKSEIEERKREAATIAITSVPVREMEVGMEDVYGEGSVLDLPHRPPWTYSTTKEELDKREAAAFAAYLHDIHSKYGHSQLSYFEHNLETWRQLWRVLEISDVILLIADIRHPALHFSPALYSYVVKELKKRLILVLNKVDLVPPEVAVAWRHYFLSKFCQLDVICFTSYPSQLASSQPPEKVKLKFRHGRGKLPSAVGPQELLKLVEKICHDKINLDEWRQKLAETIPIITPTERAAVELGSEFEDEEESNEEEEEEEHQDGNFEVISSPMNLECVREGALTIGMLGHPNVGKSSIINALMVKKVVSTSRTPGHTKHFQTLYLTPSLRLCDCPGLVFPSLVDKQLQILSGLYPVAQVREPFTGVGYLARRVPLVQLLQLFHPDQTCPTPKRTSKRRMGDFEREDVSVGTEAACASHMTKEEQTWTAWDICDAWAYKRGYYTSRAARPDTYRAANSILRLAVDGRICMYYRPTGFSDSKALWEGHREVAELIRLQQVGMGSSSGSYQLSNTGGEKSAMMVADDRVDDGKDKHT